MNKDPWGHLLYVSRTPDPELLQLLAERGWLVSSVESLRDAQRLIAKDTPTVGVFDFSSGYSARQIAAFETLFTTPGIGWVTSVAETQLDDYLVRRLIRLYFFDFVTLPYSPRRITDAIDHAHAMATLDKTELDLQPADDTEMIGNC